MRSGFSVGGALRDLFYDSHSSPALAKAKRLPEYIL